MRLLPALFLFLFLYLALALPATARTLSIELAQNGLAATESRLTALATPTPTT